MTALIRYDAACAALEAAVTADEVMSVRVELRAIEAVARVAQNFDLEIKAIKLRTRAETRLGEMLEEGERLGIITSHGGNRKGQDSATDLDRPARLKEIGVDNKLAAYSRKLSGIGQKAVDAMLKRFDDESRKKRKPALNVIRETIADKNKASRRRLAQELSDCAALKPTGRTFSVVYADPPWRRKAGVGEKAYENQYPTMTWDEIMAMPVAKRLQKNAWLFLWIPRAHLMALHKVKVEVEDGIFTVSLPLAWAIARAWGFDSYSTCAVWTKTDDEHEDAHGTGLIFWDQDEILCVFKRGKGMPMPDGTEKVGSNYRAAKGRHSEKPSYYREIINRMCGGVPVLELFAREDDQHVLPQNFFTWGNQSRNSAEIPPEAPFDSDGNPLDHDGATGEIIDKRPNALFDDVQSEPAALDLPISAQLENEPESQLPVIAPPTEHESPLLNSESESEPLDIPDFLRRSPDAEASA